MIESWRAAELWPLIALGPFTWRLLGVLEVRRVRRAQRVLGPRLELLAVDRDPAVPGRRARWAGLAVLAAVCAWLGPRGAPVVPLVPAAGLDLVVCLDVSRSMWARDVAPNRLERARAELAELAAHVPGDRLALVTFAGEAELVVPLTHDVASWTALLEDADPLTASRGGSDLAAAVTTALETLPDARGRHQALLLVGDGEHMGAALDAVADQAVERGVEIHGLVLGSPRGRRIPLPADGGAADDSGYLLDRDGLAVLTRSDAGLVRQLTSPTGGRCMLVEGVAPDAGPWLVPWYDDTLRARSQELVPEPTRARPAERFQWPLLAALVLGMLAVSTSERRVSW